MGTRHRPFLPTPVTIAELRPGDQCMSPGQARELCEAFPAPPNALPPGARVAKCNSQPGDGHADGATATVIGALGMSGAFGYFVEWDDRRRVAVFVLQGKVRAVGPV